MHISTSEPKFSLAIRSLWPATLAMLMLAGCADNPSSSSTATTTPRTGDAREGTQYDQLNNVAIAQMKAGDWKSACEGLNQAIALAPDRPEAYYNYGRAHLGQKQYLPAERAFLKAQEVDPTYAPSYYFFAKVMVIKEDLPTAYDAAEKAVELSDSQEWEYLVLLGELSAAVSDPLRAKLAFNSALGLLEERRNKIERVVNAEARRFGIREISYDTEFTANPALGKAIATTEISYDEELWLPREDLRNELKATEGLIDQVKARKTTVLAATQPPSP